MSEPQTPVSPEGGGTPRPASVTLRTEGEPRRGAGIDPAHQSLADALRLVFRGLQVAMVALLVVFAFSGVQKVNENEKGIKLLFGRPMGDELPPGPQFAAPYPFGELVKVPTGLERLDVSETFWPKLTADQQGLSVEKLAAFNRPTLKPGEDGMNITGDSNVAHTRWQVQFVRARPSEWARNIIKEEEAGIVRAAVERGVVHALAEVKIDDLLRQTGGDQGSVARKAQAVAQKMLDDIQSGIHIEQLTLQEKSPPFFAYSAFAGVQAAEQKAGEKRIAAQSQARTTLNAMAGGAQEGLIRAIDAYEKAAALGDTPAQQKLMEAIDTILDGKAADVEGAKVPEGVAAGRVTALLNEARQYRSTIVNRRRSELAMFKAKLEQFRSNPDLVVQRDWSDAMTRLLSRDMVEVFWVPPMMDRVELWLNRDLNAQRSYELVQKLRAQQAKDERQRLEREKEATKTRTDLQEMNIEADLKKR